MPVSWWVEFGQKTRFTTCNVSFHSWWQMLFIYDVTAFPTSLWHYCFRVDVTKHVKRLEPDRELIVTQEWRHLECNLWCALLTRDLHVGHGHIGIWWEATFRLWTIWSDVLPRLLIFHIFDWWGCHFQALIANSDDRSVSFRAYNQTWQWTNGGRP